MISWKYYRRNAFCHQVLSLVYLLVGRADSHLSPVTFSWAYEKLLQGLARLNPKLMCILGGVLIWPEDAAKIKQNAEEINIRLAWLADKDQHWLAFNPNISLGLGGVPRRRVFDKNGRVLKVGCRALLQAIVAASKSPCMLQNYGVLPPVGCV